MKCVAKTLEGLEDLLVDELSNLSVTNITKLKRAVSFETDKEGMYRCNYNLRTALNILTPIASDEVNNENQLYAFASKIKWDRYMDEHKTFVINYTVNSPYFKHTQYAALKVKDAICDFFRKRYGTRPSVDKDYPDLRIDLHINMTEVNISLDSSGESLFKRGYRRHTGDAPINEVLAAGIVQLSGWDKKTTFLDPMCGSGTIPIEAHMLANKIPGGYFKIRFGFQDWVDFEHRLWKKVKEESNAKMFDSGVKIIGSDEDDDIIQAIKRQSKNIPYTDNITFETADFLESKPRKDIFMIMNPPYDQRLSKDNIEEFYKLIGNRLKFKYSGTTACIISGNKDALKFVGLKPDKKIPLFNGPIESRFCIYSLYDGSKAVN